MNFYEPAIMTWIFIFGYFLLIGLASFFVIWLAMRVATRQQRRLTKITNRLLVEQLKNQGVSESRIHELLYAK